MATFDQLYSRLDSDWRVRGEQFEHLCIWYLENAPRFSGLVESACFFTEWPDRWDDRDLGVDIIVETVDGETWAVQAKCYKPRLAVKKRDVDAFLSESGRRGISGRILIMTTDLLAEDARRTIQDQAIPVQVVSLSDLQGEQLDWPEDLAELPERSSSRNWETLQERFSGTQTSEVEEVYREEETWSAEQVPEEPLRQVGQKYGVPADSPRRRVGGESPEPSPTPEELRQMELEYEREWKRELKQINKKVYAEAWGEYWSFMFKVCLVIAGIVVVVVLLEGGC